MRWALYVAIPFCLMTLAPPPGAPESIVETWPRPLGPKQPPPGWTLKEVSGSISEGDITVEEEEGKSVLHLRSRATSYILGREDLKVDLGKTPLLTWRWKVRTSPVGGDARDPATDDQPVALYVTLSDAEGREKRALGYLWDVKAPRCRYFINPREKSFIKRSALRMAGVPVTWYIILRNAESPTEVWLTESRDVTQDYRQIFNASPSTAVALGLQIDSASTATSAESFVGPIAFHSPGPRPEESRETPCESIRPLQ